MRNAKFYIIYIQIMVWGSIAAQGLSDYRAGGLGEVEHSWI